MTGIFFERPATLMSIADRRERDKQKRRASIVDAAEKLFFAKGFAATTIDEIAAAAELSKGTIYLYFKTKEEISIEIARRGARLLMDLSRAAVDAAPSGREKVKALGRALLTFYERHPDHFKTLFYQHRGASCRSSEARDEDPLIKALIQDRKELHDFGVSVVRDGIVDGTVRPDADPVKVTLVLVGMFIGLIRMASVEEKALLKMFHVTGSDLIKEAFELMDRPLADVRSKTARGGP
jgi:TetR/AcrR family transcriptional regulator